MGFPCEIPENTECDILRFMHSHLGSVYLVELFANRNSNKFQLQGHFIRKCNYASSLSVPSLVRTLLHFDYANCAGISMIRWNGY